MIHNVLKKCDGKKAAARKITVLQLQKICGILNFLGHTIVPGRAFTRRLYSNLAHVNLKPHHHVRVTER